MGAYDCDCINNLEYDRRERKQKEQSRSTAQSTARSTAQSTDLIDRQAAIDGKIVIQRTNGVEIYSDEAVPVEYLKNLPSRQPEPSTNCSEIPNSSDTISRQAVIDICANAIDLWHGQLGEGALVAVRDKIAELTPAEPKTGRWIYCEDTTADCVDGYRCDQCGLFVPWDYQHKSIDYIKDYNFCPNCGAKMEGISMDDLISRQAAIDALWKALYEYEDNTEKQFQESEELDVADWVQHRIFVQNMNDIDRRTLLELPSAQPEPKEGHWVDGRCSKCGGQAPFWVMASTYYESDFCPHCGTKMKGETT